jgi:16S rRNA (guanine(527)-N(7))-methyltransferase RsmG
MLPEGGAQPPESFRALLEERTPLFGLTVSGKVLDGLARFLSHLDRARRQTNLTGRLMAKDLVDHALESALGERLISHGARVIDIGSGAGFPGVPLAILRPDISVTLVEPRRKRLEFLSRLSQEVPVSNLASPMKSLSLLGKGAADAATARAVGGLEDLLGKAHFLVPGGLFLAWTTEVDRISRRLSSLFDLEADLPVPESRRKRIAAFRKRDVPRGTGITPPGRS